MRESNPPNYLGKVAHYHYDNTARWQWDQDSNPDKEVWKLSCLPLHYPTMERCVGIEPTEYRFADGRLLPVSQQRKNQVNKGLRSSMPFGVSKFESDC